MQKIQLSIPEPCQQNWQQMTPTDQGRFCNACAKEVIDFSMMTDTQVLQYFTTLTHDKVCGRALPGQLDRTISTPEHPKKKIFWYWNYIVMFLMFFAKGNTAKAQGGVKPFTEFSPIKTNNIRGEMAVVTGVNKEVSRVIKGKVTDTAGNPVPFASIKIKGSNAGISADGNGAYSFKVNSESTLIISGTGYKTKEVFTGTELILNTVLEPYPRLGEVEITTIAGSIRRRNLDEEYRNTNTSKRIAVFEVKEDNSGLLLDKAKITITRKADHKTDTAFTGKKGIYKFQGIKEHNSYVVKVEAAGYETNEFVVNGNDFTDRKKVWEVLLRRQKVEAENTQDAGLASSIKTDKILDTKIKGLNITSTNKATSNFDTRIRVGGIRSINTYNEPLLTVDYLPVSFNHFASLNPNDIENIQVLKATVASLLYGTDARYGVIAITTKKKAREKRELAKNSVAKKMLTKVSDTLSTALNTNTLKVYPNPIKKGNTFFVSFKQQKVNDFWIRITDMQGRVLFQKQINALAKEHFEKIVADNNWSSGLYYISIINKNNQLTNKGSFIVQ